MKESEKGQRRWGGGDRGAISFTVFFVCLFYLFVFSFFFLFFLFFCEN